MNGKTRSRAAVEILSYFVRNREAVDTYEGIARWRLMEQAIHYTTIQTQEALAWLVSEGYLTESRSTGTPPIYSLNQARQRDAERIAASTNSPEISSEDGKRN
jgi:hypothetical protein